MKAAAILALAVALAPLTSRTNSDAAARRGVRAFEKNDFATAARELGEAAKLRPSPQASFNLATAETAAGDARSAARDFEEAIRDPRVRPEALYNRGTGALVRGDLPAAIHDLTAALRDSPHHAGAKRNLEIALRRQETQRRAGGGGDSDRKPSGGDENRKPSTAGRPAPQRGETDAEQILRSVRQQEVEELSRMRQPSGQRRVGW